MSSLDRSALERVLARAAELQSQDSADPGAALTDEQVVELGKEVGLTPAVIRQAIAEERGRVTIPEVAGGGGVSAYYGPPVVSAARVVRGAPASLLAALDQAMRGELLFDVSRRFPTRMQWTPKRGFFDTMRSQFVRGVEGIDLRITEEVAASALAVDGDTTHVRLDATLAVVRRGALRRGVIAAALSGAVALVFGVAGAPLVVAVPIFATGSTLGVMQTRARYRSTLRRVGVALEQLLDRLEFGPARRRENLVEKLLG